MIVDQLFVACIAPRFEEKSLDLMHAVADKVLDADEDDFVAVMASPDCVDAWKTGLEDGAETTAEWEEAVSVSLQNISGFYCQ